MPKIEVFERQRVQIYYPTDENGDLASIRVETPYDIEDDVELELQSNGNIYESYISRDRIPDLIAVLKKYLAVTQ